MQVKSRKRDPYDPEVPIVKLALLVEPKKTFTLKQLSKMAEFRVDKVARTLAKYEVKANAEGEFPGQAIIRAAKGYLSELEALEVL